MSIEMMNLVLERRDLQGTRRWVLAMLADRADERGMCWPGVNWLAKRTAVSRRSVQRAISELVSEGWLERHTNAGPASRADRRPSMYRIILKRDDATVIPSDTPRGDTDDTPHGVTRGDTHDTPKAPRGDKLGSHGVTPVTPRGDTSVTLTVREPSVEPSERGQEPSPSPGESESSKTPTLVEWIAHASSIGYTDEADAEQAWHHYEATKTPAGWWLQRGGGKIRNWRAACVTCRGNWERFRRAGRPPRTAGHREEKSSEGAGGSPPTAFDSTAPDAHTGGVPVAMPVAAGESWGLAFARSDAGVAS